MEGQKNIDLSQKQTPVDGQAASPRPINSDDIITRVSSFLMEQAPDKSVVQNDISIEGFDPKAIDEIQDPQAKQFAQKAYDEMKRGLHKKFQELAELRKQYEQSKDTQTNTWTPDRIKQLMKDPEFVKSAQQVVGPNLEEDSDVYSALSDQERQEIQMLKNELMAIKQHSALMTKSQQDEQLRTKYPNYDPQSVDTLIDRMMDGSVSAGREEIWKVLNYDQAVKAAYQMGLNDLKSGTVDKIDSMSNFGNNIQQSAVLPERREKENNESFAKRVFLSAFKQQQQ